MFHSLGAEQENAPLYSEVRANGVYKVPFVLIVDSMSMSGTSVYAILLCSLVSVVLFNALYIRTALLYFILLLTENQSCS